MAGFRAAFFPEGKQGFLEHTIRVARVIFMFLVGLETDQNYMRRSFSRASVVAAVGLAASILVVFSATAGLRSLEETSGFFIPDLFSILIFSTTASPIVVRMAAELKLATTEVGRVATSSSLINDMFTLTALGFLSLWLAFAPYDGSAPAALEILMMLASFLLIVAGCFCVRPLTKWLNSRTEARRQLRYNDVSIALTFTLGISACVESMSRNGMLAAFLIGALMPREGRTARTLISKLTYPVNSLVLPIYFGSTGLATNLADSFHTKHKMAVFAILFVGPLAKLAATFLFSRHYYKMTAYDSFLLGLLLTAKGHVDLALISLAREAKIISHQAYKVLTATLVTTALGVGLITTFVVKSRRRNRSHVNLGLERDRPDSDLRLIACVHTTRELPAVLNLLEASRGTDKAPLIAFLMHLIEFTEDVSIATQLFYHQYEDYDEYEYGRDDAIQINNAVDSFNLETGVTIRQLTAVSSFSSMHHDILDAVQSIRAALLVLPFHRRQTVDGKMDKGHDGIRLVNQKVIKAAKCTVGILVDRGLGGTTQVSAMQASHHIAVLFFGGADDREALAYGCRMADHPNVNLTVIRFQPSSGAASYEASAGTNEDEEVLTSLSKHEKEIDADRDFLLNFYDRYVVTGLVSYVDKFVDNGAQTVTTLTAMEGMFSLFVVGKGGRGLSPLTTGIGEWEEYPELGAIGDLLASSDFTLSGSVLVIQQYRPTKKKNKSVLEEDDEFALTSL
ncbi:hypothetical protein ACLOJK_002302 [Asimina triloba]